jgi:GNAT superfamily N-acetyltransferase
MPQCEGATLVTPSTSDDLGGQPSGFRLARPDDVDRLVDLIRAAYRGETSRAGWTSEAALVAGDRISAEQVRGMIDEPGSIFLVVDQGGAGSDGVAGAGGLTGCCRVADLGGGLARFGTFAVWPSAQGGGVGRRLMAEADRRAVETFGAARMEITVLAQQEKLLAWYERRGYRRTGQTRPFPADERFARPLRDGLYFAVMEKSLA